MLTLIFITAVICLNTIVGYNIQRSGSKSEIISSPWNTTSLDTYYDDFEDQQRKPVLCQGYGEFYHRETKQCYKSDSQGPCPDMMEFRYDYSPGNPDYLSYGVCQCKSATCEGRPVVLWEPTQKCYHAYQQGPCPKGQWLVVKNRRVKCEKNPCLQTPGTNNFEYTPETPFWFPHNGECYKTNTTAFCENKDEIVTFLTFIPEYYCTILDGCAAGSNFSSGGGGFNPRPLGCSSGEQTNTGCEPSAPVAPEAEN